MKRALRSARREEEDLLRLFYGFSLRHTSWFAGCPACFTTVKTLGRDLVEHYVRDHPGALVLASAVPTVKPRKTPCK